MTPEGNGYFGCYVCKKYIEAGNAVNGRQAFGRFERNAHHSCGLDEIKRHVGHITGDHARALEWMRALRIAEHFGDATDASATVACSDGIADAYERACAQRDREKITLQQEHLCFLAYHCAKRNFSREDYSATCKATFAIGASLDKTHWSGACFDEWLDVFGQTMFLELMRKIRNSPTLSVNCDEGKGHFSIRVHFLDSDFVPTTEFYQVRKVYHKDHRSLCECIISAFTESPNDEYVPKRYMLTQRDLGMKLIGLTADGAPVMGMNQNAMGGN